MCVHRKPYNRPNESTIRVNRVNTIVVHIRKFEVPFEFCLGNFLKTDFGENHSGTKIGILFASLDVCVLIMFI